MNVQIEFDDLPNSFKIIPLEQFMEYANFIYKQHNKKNFTLTYRSNICILVCKFSYIEAFEKSWLEYKNETFNENIEKLLK